MAHRLETLIAKTRQLAGLSNARELDDRQLLQQFAGGDETAFTALVDRYGGLVMGVCRRILQHTQDAEDAFQATFLVLARKAGKVAWKESVASWLHAVACRISFQVRREKARHAASGVADMAMPQAADPVWSDLRPVLDEELDRLPTRYRIPLILCCLEGKSRDEAAQQLGWSVGSVKGRLERGRELLRSRLARRGLTLSAALAATLITATGASAAVPLTLGLETVRAGMAMLDGQTAGVVSTQALTLAQGALHAMFITKLKFAAAIVLAVVTFGLGTGYVSHLALAGADPSTFAARLDPKKDSKPKEDAQQGQKDDGQQNQKEDGQKNQQDDGQQNQDAATAFVPDLAEFLTQREERKQPASVSGVVKSVAPKSITLLVARNEPDGKTFEVAKDVKVIIREGRETKAAKLTDVKEKTRVTLLLDDAKKTVQTIEIQTARREGGDGGERRPDDGRTFRGYVTEIVAGKSISFQTGGRSDPPKTTTFELAKDVKVSLRTGRNVKDGKLDDVPLKSYIQVKLDETKKIVQAIDVTTSTTRSGAVSEIDDKSITLVSGRDDVKSMTYPLAKDVKVQYWLPGTTAVRGEPSQAKTLKLADVKAKMIVHVQLDDELKTVQSITVDLPQMRGTVGAVDAKKLTLALNPGRGDDLNLTVAKDARIMIDGKAGTLEKVAAGAEVHVILSPDRTQVLSLQTPLPQRREQ